MNSFSITDIGVKRQTNQDFVFRSEDAIGSLPNLFVVADGMGGHKAGDFASRYCVETAVDAIKKSNRKTIVGILEEAIKTANDALIKQASSHIDYEGMGTTFVAAVLANDNIYVANIGDSRLYLIEKEIMQITEDHSLVEAMVRNGEIEKREARHHPNKNIITRAVGSNRQVEADYFEVQVKRDDMVLLCSDGLTNMLEDDEIFRIVKEYGRDVEETANKLVERANENGGKDNIAIVLIHI